MKHINLLVFVTQLGLSVVFPLGGCTLLALWLRQRFALGSWVLVAGIVLGLVTAFDAFRQTLNAMSRLSRDRRENEPPPVSFNDHL